jgi:maltose/maltodextrin transport system substrate-binding protein
VDNAYTSSVILPVLLFDELMAVPDAAFAGIDTAGFRDALSQARTRALNWIIQGPLRDYRWEGFCEDVGDMPPYEATEWYDAGWTAKYLIEHRQEFPRQFDAALRLLDWIEDQFVCWSALDVPYLESRQPVVPVVMEQYRCYKPVDCCNAWLAEVLLAAYRATGREIYLQKSRALAAALTHFRRPNGSFATWCFYTSPDRPMENGDWFSCMVCDAYVLMRHGKELQG